METNTEEDDKAFPLAQGSPKDNEHNLKTILTTKTNLRCVLLRAEHHRVFLGNCQKEDIIPKGFRLNREIHFMRGAEDCQTAAKSEDVLTKAEKDLRDTLAEHYDDLITNTTSKLSAVEDKLHKHTKKRDMSIREQKDILSSVHRSE